MSRWLGVLAACAAALIAAPGAGAHTDYFMPACDTMAQPTDDTGGGLMYDSGGCYDWQVSPTYQGYYYSDDTAADAAEPPPPSPVTPSIPTWRNLYDWPNGHGYVGWHTASSSQAGAYGLQANLGGNYGLWLWPVGGSAYRYSEGQYAEWTYTAPGTTRLSSATLTLSYKNKLLSHHCIDIGFLNASGAIVTQDEHCTPVRPPDSQRLTTISLVDPASNPTSKVLYVRIRVDCGGASTCSKNIPQLDPLSTGAYARLTMVDMKLVDDDLPTVAASGPFRDLDGTYINGRGAYDLTLGASDAGSGVQRIWAERIGAGELVGHDSPCDPTHKTPALDNRICPQSDSSTSTIDTNPFPEGTNRFVGKAKDVAGNVGTTQQWTVKVDRTAPLVTSGFTLVDFEPTDGIGEVDWQNAGDPALPDGTPGSGVGSYLVRFNVNGGGWTDWQSTPESNLVFDAGNVGDTLQIEVQVFDNVGNASPVAAGSVTLAAVDGVDHPDTATDEDTAEAALMRDWGVTADEAAARVDRQASIEAMDDYLTTNNPDTYGGLWVDEANGGAVKVATTQPGITAGLAAQFGLPDGLVQEVPVTRSMTTLDAIADDVYARVASVTVEPDQPSTLVMPASNTVELRVPNPFDTQVQNMITDLRNTYGSALHVTVDATDVEALACTRFKCPPPIRGGIEIWHDLHNGYITLCSIGFYVKTADGTPSILTAGHCGTGLWWHGRPKGHRIGSVTQRQFGGRVDSEVIKINDTSFWQPQNWVYHSAAMPSFTITSVARRVSVGTYLCHSGRTTGTHCGRVISTGLSWKGKLKGLVEVQACSGEGDSGGSVYNVRQHRAYGVLSLGTPCTHTKRDRFDFLPIQNTINAFNIKVVTQ